MKALTQEQSDAIIKWINTKVPKITANYPDAERQIHLAFQRDFPIQWAKPEPEDDRTQQEQYDGYAVHGSNARAINTERTKPQGDDVIAAYHMDRIKEAVVPVNGLKNLSRLL